MACVEDMTGAGRMILKMWIMHKATEYVFLRLKVLLYLLIQTDHQDTSSG
jgi:hypothetical protein